MAPRERAQLACANLARPGAIVVISLSTADHPSAARRHRAAERVDVVAVPGWGGPGPPAAGRVWDDISERARGYRDVETAMTDLTRIADTVSQGMDSFTGRASTVAAPTVGLCDGDAGVESESDGRHDGPQGRPRSRRPQPDRALAQQTADWLVDCFTRRTTAIPVTASIDPGGGQFLITPTTTRRR